MHQSLTSSLFGNFLIYKYENSSQGQRRRSNVTEI